MQEVVTFLSKARDATDKGTDEVLKYVQAKDIHSSFVAHVQPKIEAFADLDEVTLEDVTLAVEARTNMTGMLVAAKKQMREKLPPREELAKLVAYPVSRFGNLFYEIKGFFFFFI